MRLRLRSSTNFISLGLACLTLSLVLMAHSLGIAPDEARALLRARVQTAELVAAQCSPAAGAGDVATMSAILRQIVARNPDLTSAGLRHSSGKLVYSYGPHEKTWGDRGSRASAIIELSVPIATEKGEWGQVEFCFPRDVTRLPAFVPQSLRGFLGNPALRIAGFVAAGGFLCYSVYLRRTLRHLDPSAVIPPRVRAMLDALSEGVIVMDKKGQIVMANEWFSRSTGLPQRKLQGNKAARLGWTRAHSDEPAASVPWTEVLATGQPIKGAPLGLRVYSPGEDGASVATTPPEHAAHHVFSVNAAPILGPDGSVRGALATFDDVTEIEKINIALQESRDEVESQNVRLRLLATIDPMTGCLNRRSFLAEFDGHWARIESHNEVLGCVMADVDMFKSINDRFGHAAGDTVLKDVARILMEAASDVGGLVCRYGGEEFCLLLPGKDVEESAEFAERLRAAIQNEPWQITPVTTSFGVASSRQGAGEVKDLLDQADRALYASKRAGRNRVTCWGNLPAETETAALAGTKAAAGPIDVLTPSLLRDQGAQQSFLTLIAALAQRDTATALHSRRVTDYCMMAAPGLLSAEESAHLEVAALLHDVGKVAVPDSILLKSGPLTPEEWEIMRTHERIGVDLAATAGMPPPVLAIIAAHHAKFTAPADPEAAMPESDQVPIAARLLSIADAYDAMTSSRPYRKAMAHEPALKELRRCAGKQFDPGVVEHFIAAIERAAKASLLPRQAA